MEFDIATLSPTYKMLTGIPGKSNAFEISLKLGLPPEIVEKAGTLIDRGDIEFEDVISAIEADRKKAAAERDEAVMLGIEAKRLKDELQKKQASFEEQKEKLLEKAKDEARDIIEEAKAISAELQNELKELAKAGNSGEKPARLAEIRKKLKEAEGKYRGRRMPVHNADPADISDIKEGSRVKIVSLDQKGEALSLPDERGDLLVQIGALKVNVNIRDLMMIREATGRKTEKSKKYGGMYGQKTRSISVSINVQGKNLDDAAMDVDKYLDDAFMAGLSSVTVIHGRGEGILRNGLHNMFKEHKHVKSFRKGTYGEGGDGVTIVELLH